MIVVVGSPDEDELRDFELLCHDANNIPIYCPPSLLPFLKSTNQVVCNKDTLKSVIDNDVVGKQSIMLKSYTYALNRRLEKEKNILKTDLSGSMNAMQVFSWNDYDIDRAFKWVIEAIRSGEVKIIQRSAQKVELQKKSQKQEAKPKVDKKKGQKTMRPEGSNEGEFVPRSEKARIVLGAVNLMSLYHEGKWTRPKRLKGVTKHRIGAVSSDAVHILTMAKAIANKPPRKVPFRYPDITVGNGKCHIRALFTIDPDNGSLAQLATEEKVRHNEPARVKNLVDRDDRISTSCVSVHRLKQEHWVALTRDAYTDDQLTYDVTNYELARQILNELEEKQPDMVKVHWMVVYQVAQ